MTFLHPWAIGLGLAGAALPLVIHWLTRPRPQPLPLSTLRFVREAVQQRRARNRLRDWLILLLRILALLLFAAAIARPQAAPTALVNPGEPGSAVRIVIVDVSQSMAAESHGVRMFERARAQAAGYLGDQAGLQANLVLAGAMARPTFDRPSRNLPALRQELARAQALPERLNVQAALQRAGELFAKSGTDASQRRELVVVSDFQRTNWAAANFAALPEDVRIQLDSVAPAEKLPNLGILRVGSSDRPEVGRELVLEVDVGNYTPAARRVQVEAVLGDAVFRLEGLCPPGNRTTLSTPIVLRSAGWQAGEARLLNVNDALAADNVRPFVLEVRPPATYALITGQSAEQVPSSSYYLERALSPLAGRPGRAEPRVVRVAPGQVERDTLASAEVLVLDHPGRLGREAIQLLATLLRRGRGILYVTAEPQDAVNLGLLAEAAGADLQLPVEFLPPPASQRRRNLFLIDTRRDQAPFRIFGDSLGPLTGSLRFGGGLATRRRDQALADDILATYSDRSACLVVGSCGEGTLVVLNADLGDSNLAASPLFVPLVGELIGRLLSRRRSTEALACGEPVAAYLPTAAGSAAGLRLLGPQDRGDQLGELVEEALGVLWRCPAPPAPGVYQVKRKETTVFALAAAAPPEESDLQPLEAAVLSERLAGAHALQVRAVVNDDEQRDDIWAWLALACVCCALSEVLALKVFRM